MIAFVLSLALAATPPHSPILPPEQQVETLNEALLAFDRGTDLRTTNPGEATRAFRESAEKLQALVDSGIRNGRLYYNLANSYLRCGELGRAILNYRRADQLIPGDGRLEANLRFARDLCRNQIAPSGRRTLLHTIFAWHFAVPIRWRFALGLTGYLIFWTLLSARLFWPVFRWSWVLVPVAILWMVLAGSITYEMVFQSRQPQGVLLANDVTVGKSYGENPDPQFDQPLHEGVEFVVLNRHQDWLLIELPDGKSGWIRASKAELI